MICRLIPMFRSIRKIVRPHRERLVALVMLPAFFLASLPHAACICADGQREEFCKAVACRFVKRSTSNNACRGCSCCQTQSNSGNHACCKKQNSQSSESSPCRLTGLGATSNSCCHPIVETPVPATVTGHVKAELPQRLVAFVEFAPPVLVSGKIRPEFNLFDTAGPPPLDTVIVLKRLTI